MGRLWQEEEVKCLPGFQNGVKFSHHLDLFLNEWFKGKEWGAILVQVSIAVKRHYDHGNSYLIEGTSLQFHGPGIIIMVGSMWHAGRRGRGPESPTSGRQHEVD